jgi:hypothetical protein
VVRVKDAWNETGPASSCELLRRTIIVREGLNMQWILAGAAATAVVVIGGLVIFVRKSGAHLQAIMVMLLTEAAQLVFSIFTSLANLISDGIVFSYLWRGDLKVSEAVSEAYTTAYASLLCFAVVATVISVAYRISNARLMQTHVRQLAPQSHPLAAKEAHRQAQQHEWELAQTHRTKVTLLLSLLSVIMQGAPGSAKLPNERKADRSPCAACLPMSSACARLCVPCEPARARIVKHTCLPLQICPCPS